MARDFLAFILAGGSDEYYDFVGHNSSPDGELGRGMAVVQFDVEAVLRRPLASRRHLAR
jgi:hypothetical protein